MGELHFEYPAWFFLIVIFIVCGRFCKPRSEALFFPHIDIFVQTQSYQAVLLGVLKWLTILFAVTALASPVVEDRIQMQKNEGYAIALVMDSSGSMKFGFGERYIGMLASGSESKFDISKRLAQAFVKMRKNDQIGLVVFGNFAYVAAPLTYDEQVLSQMIDALYPGISGSNYTVINDALFQCAKLFSTSKAKTKIAILLTDGQSRGDNVPFDVSMKLIKKYGVKVYTVGIGKDKDFDKKHLEMIAKESGGIFFAAHNKEDLQAVYTRIDMLEKSEIESEQYVKKNYYYELPLFVAFMTLLFYTFLLNKKGTV